MIQTGADSRTLVAVTMRPSTLCVLLLLAACDPGEVVLLAPDKSPSDAPALTIHAVIDTPYVDLAEGLGWTLGVPGARVRVHRMVEPYDDSYWHVATADSVGIATFVGLLAGPYEVQVTRWLNGAEMVQADSALHLFAGGRRLNVHPGTEQEVTMVPDRRGSLVFSEFGLAIPLPWETNGSYDDAKYIEVFNNSDTTIYLDGKYWGSGWDLNRDYPYWPCAETEIVRDDPQGIWAARIFRFPGGGTEHPLEPGQAAVVAKSAVDHSAVHPALYDLRQADFELANGRNADDPDVPNMEFVGIRAAQAAWPIWGMPMFLSLPADVATLARYVDPYSGAQWVQIPRALVLDASVATIDWAAGSYQAYPACLEDLNDVFERLAGPAADEASDIYDGLSAQRQVVSVLPNGRKVLQDTETSMVDFVKASRSPGWIPDWLP